MKRPFFYAMYCLLLAGCVLGSRNPFYTPELVVDLPQLYGTWYFDEGEGKDESPLVVSQGKMTIFDDKGVPADAKAVFFKIDDTIFVDIFPDEGQLKQDTVGDEPPVHSINRVKIEGDGVFFNPLDYDWLIKEVDAGRIALPYQRSSENGDVLFTASSQQWVEFLRAHKDDLKAFPSDSKAKLIQKATAAKTVP